MSKRRHHSSKVVLQLAFAGQVLGLSQVGPDFMILKALPKSSESAMAGRVDVIVDDRVASSQKVMLPYGILAGTKKITYF